MELKTQVDPWKRRRARVRCVELRAPRANGGKPTWLSMRFTKYCVLAALPGTGPVADRSESTTPPRTQLRGPRAIQLAYRGGAPASQGERELSLRRYRCPTQARTSWCPKARSYVEITEWDHAGISPQAPIMVRRQRRGRVSTSPTIGPPLYLHQDIVIYVISYEKRATCLSSLSRRTRRPGGNWAGRAVALGGATGTCFVVVLRWSITRALSYDV